MWVMVMRCVFKHHVYLCVVSTALMAGLSLITSHTSKAYAQTPNCGSGSGGGVKVVDNVVGPIVCSSGETRILSSTRGGSSEISIDMNRHSREEAAVTVTGPGTNITIMKSLKVINGKGKSGLPVIKVLDKGQLTLNQEVDVDGVTIKKEIVVDGENSSVTLNGVLKGFDGMEVKVSKGGMVVFEKGVTGIDGMEVGINGGGTVRLMKDVTFNNGSEAGIKIEGSGEASVIGVGKMVTMTVKGKGDGIQMDGDGGTASVVMLNIVGKGSGAGSTGKGVDMQNGREMTLNMVNVSGFRVGVNAKNGTVKINGESTITVKDGGTGISMSGSGATVKMMEGKIEGSGEGTGVQGMGGTGTVELTKVAIEGVKKGVDMQGGTLKVMGGTVTFESERGNYGVQVMGTGTADLMGTKIVGGGNGEGKGVIMESSGKMTMTNVDISKVKVGVEAQRGTVNINMGEITFESGNGNYGVHVQNGVKMANLTSVTITGGGQGTGLYVEGTATMNGGEISNVSEGVYATGAGNLTINGGTNITFKGDYGVKVMGTATANITGATIKGEGSGVGSKGVIMESTGEMMMTNVTISDVDKGVWMNGAGGTMTMNNVQISKVKMGVEVQAGTLNMMGGTVTFEGGRDNYGVRVGSGVTSARLTDVTITGAGSGKGVLMDGRGTGATGTLNMTGVRISDVAMGVEAITGTLTINGHSRITFNNGAGNYGVRVQNGANADLTNVMITGEGGNGEGSKGVLMEGREMMMEKVTISNVAMGVEATNGTLTIKGGEIGFKDGVGNYGVKVGDRVTSARLTDVKIKGDGDGEGSKGVIMGGREMTMTDVRISGVQTGVEVTSGNLTISGGTMTGVQTGISMMGSGMLTVSGAKITFTGEHGVKVQNGATANLTDVRIVGGGATGKGVIMESSGTLTLTKVEISDVAMGVDVKGAGNLTVSGGEMTGVQTGIDMSGSGKLVVNNGARITFKGDHGVRVESGVTSASLTDVRIVGGGSGQGTGVVMGGTGGMTLTSVGISKVKVGVDAT
ncbi:right-handed parallel beta-helix repeat-containing protein, partial [Bartonella bovis]|uniref:right-handed parallel beta-helix repeat-containing protein n=1 Tax=Bartonella bovis TaxID=155194 RepID=UPI001ABB6E7C